LLEVVMAVEYVARISEGDYAMFRTIMKTALPSDYDMWLRVRERGRSRAFNQRGAVCTEVDITPEEFTAYCKQFRRRDFTIASLDACARSKALWQGGR
jgi:hypothetical protein